MSDFPSKRQRREHEWTETISREVASTRMRTVKSRTEKAARIHMDYRIPFRFLARHFGVKKNAIARAVQAIESDRPVGQVGAPLKLRSELERKIVESIKIHEDGFVPLSPTQIIALVIIS